MKINKKYCYECDKEVEVDFVEKVCLTSSGVSEDTRTACVCNECEQEIEED